MLLSTWNVALDDSNGMQPRQKDVFQPKVFERRNGVGLKSGAGPARLFPVGATNLAPFHLPTELASPCLTRES